MTGALLGKRSTTEEFDKFNSMTKYPSILTYHQLGERGRLTNERIFDIPRGVEIHGTEKIDGTNSRMTMILTPHGYDYFIGSREKWFYSCGDRIYNPDQGIVETFKKFDIESRISELHIAIEEAKIDTFPNGFPYGIYTIYSEVYGGEVNAWKQYTNTKTYGFRVFDISYISFPQYYDLAALPREEIAHWRDNGNQTFLSANRRLEICEIMGLETVPYIFCFKSDDLPVTLEETLEFLNKFKTTKAGIDAEGEAEGVVIRTSDRSIIAKIRFEDYRRTLNIQKKKK